MPKLLFAGDVQGRLEALFKRVATVNAANGPFDALFCVGTFFEPSGAEDADYAGELLPYLTDGKHAPLPTYFVGGYGAGARQALEALAAVPESGIHYLGRSGLRKVAGLSVAFLDGSYKAAAHVQQGAAGGGAGTARPSARYYSELDVSQLKSQAAASDGDVDVLLTCEWPSGAAEGLPVAARPGGSAPEGSAVCADIALAVRPRYHIAGGAGLHWARPPYVNEDLGAGAHATRFISLAEVGNAVKQRWLHALNLTAAADMPPEQLLALPEGSTPCPYVRGGPGAGRKRGLAELAGADADGALGAQSWRWQERGKRPKAPMAAPSLGRSDIAKDKARTAFVGNVPFAATEEDLVAFFSQCGAVEDVVRRASAEGRLNTFCHIQFASVEAMERACQLNGSLFMGRELRVDPALSGEGEGRKAGKKLGAPVAGCWFCLSNPNADVDLVASIGEECYLVLDKGAIADTHALLLPVEHYPSTLSLPPSAAAELDQYMSALRTCFAASGRRLVGFERYMKLRKSGGNHAHVNVVAVPSSAAAEARAVFERLAAQAGFSLTHLPPAKGVEEGRAALTDAVGDGEYFVGHLPDGSRLVHPIPFGERHPLPYGREVLATLLGCPERADWKACAVSREEETARTARFKATFDSYDIMK